MGIHNEPGYEQVSPIPKLKDLINNLLDLLTSTMDSERSFLPFGAPGSGNDKVVLMVNNLGGFSELELSGIARESVAQLRQRKIKLERLLVGSFMVGIHSCSCREYSLIDFSDFPQHAWILTYPSASASPRRIRSHLNG